MELVCPKSARSRGDGLALNMPHDIAEGIPHDDLETGGSLSEDRAGVGIDMIWVVAAVVIRPERAVAVFAAEHAGTAGRRAVDAGADARCGLIGGARVTGDEPIMYIDLESAGNGTDEKPTHAPLPGTPQTNSH